MQNNVGLVLSLQLIVENLSFIFSTSDLQKSVCGLFVEILQTYMHYDFVFNDLESLRVLKPHFYLRLTFVIN